jgi:hypothetical protein
MSEQMEDRIASRLSNVHNHTSRGLALELAASNDMMGGGLCGVFDWCVNNTAWVGPGSCCSPHYTAHFECNDTL